LLLASWRLETFCYAHVATDAGNTLAQARWSECQHLAGRLAILQTRYSAWIATLDLNALIDRSPIAAAHAGPLRIMAESARHQMSPEEETLAAELDGSGAAGWSRLYEQIWSSLTVAIDMDGTRQSLPMSRVRRLAFDADRDTRRRAHEEELCAWQSVAVPLAAALNGVKGQALTLAARRGWPSTLDDACATHRIDRETLDAMLTAARESFLDFRRYMKAKAIALNLDRLAWYDLVAPVGNAGVIWEFETTRDVILQQFDSYSADLRGLAERAFSDRWLDIEPRAGKQGGAFCIAVGDGTSRIMTNFASVFGDVRALAHELGHAYHYQVLNREGRTPIRQMLTPMTLSETASTFCEMLIYRTALDITTATEQLVTIDAVLQSHCRFVVDVFCGFLFEQRLFEARRERELSVGELNAMMVAAQQETYGDAVVPETFHPFMWAYRPHYFSATSSFTSFPYLFGLLFSLGLYARYEADPATFHEAFDELLAATGESDPATLAARFGIDIRTSDFWRTSLDMIRADIDRFELLVSER
jgi:pepF/M3 family oligoendopeptidase